MTKPRPRMEWPGPVAMLLSAGLVVGWVIAIVATARFESVVTSDAWTAGIFGLSGALAGGIVGYVSGHQVGTRSTYDAPDPPDDTTPFDDDAE